MRLLIKLIACVTAAYLLAAVVAIPANPEIRFWRSVDQQRDDEIATSRRVHPGKPIIFFTGGSSCAFSIDPKFVEEACEMPAFNLGLPVAAGPKYLLHQALERAKPGDFLVIALEPDLLTYPEVFAASPFSFAMAASTGNPSFASGGNSFADTLTIREYLNLSRPGPGYTVTWIAKGLTGKGYRYRKTDILYHGHIQTSVTDPSLPRVGVKSVSDLCPTGRDLLIAFRAAAEKKGVHLLYSMPWVLNEEGACASNRERNLKILHSINNIISTIDDGYQGAATDPTYFSDSGLHLSAKGSPIRSKALAAALKLWFESRPKSLAD